MPSNFGDQGVWVSDGGGYYINTMNTGVSKNWDSRRFIAPGKGGAFANENSAVIAWGEGMLVETHAIP